MLILVDLPHQNVNAEGKRTKYLRKPLRNIRIVFPRSHVLRESAIEVFWLTMKNSFFNFTPHANDKVEGTSDIKKGLLCDGRLRNLWWWAYSQEAARCRVQAALPAGALQRRAFTCAAEGFGPHQEVAALGNQQLRIPDASEHNRCSTTLLFMLNELVSAAGRSYNDITQYPVFPWSSFGLPVGSRSPNAVVGFSKTTSHRCWI